MMHPLYPTPKPPSAHPNSLDPSMTVNQLPLPIRGTQYSMQSFDLPCSPRPAPPKPDLSSADVSTPSTVSSWQKSFHSGRAMGLGVFDHLVKQYDTEMSSGQNSSGRSPENTSSNTSYSPPSFNGDTGSITSQSAAPKPAAPIQSTSRSLNFVNGDGNFVAPPARQVNSDFNPPSNWNFDTAGVTPKDTATGLTPGPDGDWSQMLDNMNWDSTVLDASTPQWSMSPEGTK